MFTKLTSISFSFQRQLPILNQCSVSMPPRNVKNHRLSGGIVVEHKSLTHFSPVLKPVSPFQPSVETSHLVSTAKQMTGFFYVKRNTLLKWFKSTFIIFELLRGSLVFFASAKVIFSDYFDLKMLPKKCGTIV